MSDLVYIKPENVPAELKERPQWIVWKNVERDGQKTKVPFQPNLEPAKTNDPLTWSTFEDCYAVYMLEKCDGVGFVFSEQDEYTGIDLDGCRNPLSGEVANWAKAIVMQIGSYAEVSPSRTGVKIWVKGKLPWTGKKVGLGHFSTGKEAAIEMYHTLRYFAVTGWQLAGMRDIIERQAALDFLVEKYFPVVKVQVVPSNRHHTNILERASRYVSTMPPAISGCGGHNQTFHVACVLVLGFGLTPDDAYKILLEYNERCEPPWSGRDLYRKATEADKQEGERNYLRDAIPDDWKNIEVPNYSYPTQQKLPPTPLNREPRIQTLHDAAREHLRQLKEGKADLIRTGLPELDEAIGGGVQNGEYVVIGARPSHGKTMVALQIAHHMTLTGMPCVFISEDMPNFAMGKRANQFAIDMPEEDWRGEIEQAQEQVELHFQTREETLLVEGCGTAEKAAERIRWAHKEHGAAFAIVDYLQKLNCIGKDLRERTTNASMMIRQVAIELKIPVIMLCQLSRAIESRTKFIPTMSDLKETGQIEQDADVILFLVWPHRLDKTRPKEEYHIFVEKNRNRQIKRHGVKVRFLPNRQMLMPERAQDKQNYEPSFDEWNNRD